MRKQGAYLDSWGRRGSPEENAEADNAGAALHLVSGNLTAAMRDLGLALAAAESAATLHNLGSVEAQTGELRAAEEHQRNVLSLWRGQFGERHEYVRRALVSLSSIQGLGEDWRGLARRQRVAFATGLPPADCSAPTLHFRKCYARSMSHGHRAKPGLV